MSVPDTSAREDAAETDRKILSASAVMAAGTIVSRLSGFVRSALLAAALGAYLHADIFTIANTIPNMLYILLAGGVFNAVLVPQLVRAMRDDPDGGEAYTNRVVTLAALFLGAVTLLLVLAAPLVMSLYLDSQYDAPDLAAHRESIIDFARLCLPQVFFYGMFVLVGQILNSRGKFGPMMWAPIANNVISVLVLVVYLLTFGPAEGDDRFGAFTPGQELLLGIGSTAGIVAQLLILVPFLRAAGYTFRPRFDFRGTGLGHTMRLAVWTVLFVIVNQVAYTVVVRLASSGTVGGIEGGTGYMVYSSAFLIVMVPHSIITVSLATAILPRLSARAAEGDLAGLARTLTGSLRTALAVVLPFAALLPVVAPYIAQVVWGHGAAADDFDSYVPTLALFGPGVVFFTVHYLMLRGFYALERTRTVFFIQCWVAATNIAVALVLVLNTGATQTSPALVVAYSASYAVGAAISYGVLRRVLGGLRTGELVRFLVRLLVATAISTGIALAVAWPLHRAIEDSSWLPALLVGGLVTVVDVLAFLVLARLLRLREVTSVLQTVTRRRPPAHRA
jgi:putative peptidoglycan lipid II flippase